MSVNSYLKLNFSTSGSYMFYFSYLITVGYVKCDFCCFNLLQVDAALIATGRAPFTQGLGLENVCLPNTNMLKKFKIFHELKWSNSFVDFVPADWCCNTAWFCSSGWAHASNWCKRQSGLFPDLLENIVP